MSRVQIINRSVDYLKMVVYRERKYITQNDEKFCQIVSKFKEDFNLDIADSEKIFNINGLGLNSSFKTKCLIDYRGEFFLRYGFKYISEFINWLNENKISYKITRYDIAVDYLHDQLLPFRNKKNYFGKLTKGMILIPEKFRGNTLEPSEWIQQKATYILTIYNKSREISDSRNKAKTILYPEIYTKNKVYRFEIKFLRLNNFEFLHSEDEFIKINLNNWYKKNQISGRDKKNIQKIMGQ